MLSVGHEKRQRYSGIMAIAKVGLNSNVIAGQLVDEG